MELIIEEFGGSLIMIITGSAVVGILAHIATLL